MSWTVVYDEKDGPVVLVLGVRVTYRMLLAPPLRAVKLPSGDYRIVHRDGSREDVPPDVAQERYRIEPM